MPLAQALNETTHMTDAKAFIGWLDQQASVAKNRKIGTQGYCMGGPMAFRTAAAVPDRVGAVASFHGGGLVTDMPNSPHLQAAKTKAQFLIAIAANDDMRSPNEKNVLKETFAKANLPAEIEVYAGAAHGWCPPDSGVYNEPQAEKAWSRLLALYGKALAYASVVVQAFRPAFRAGLKACTTTARLPEELSMRRLTATLVACVAGAGLYAQSASRSAAWDTYSGGAEGRRYSPLTQINTKNVSRLKLAWQYGVANASAGTSAAGRSQAVPIFVRGVALHVHGAADDRRAQSGDGDRDLEIRSRKGRSAEPRCVVLARRRPVVRANPGRNDRTDVCSRSTPETGKPVPTFGDQGAIDLRVGVAEKFPKTAVHDGLSRAHLPEPDHHRRAGTGRQP